MRLLKILGLCSEMKMNKDSFEIAILIVSLGLLDGIMVGIYNLKWGVYIGFSVVVGLTILSYIITKLSYIIIELNSEEE